DDRCMYYEALAETLWHLGCRDEALRFFSEGRRALRRARRTGGIDETSLEFVAGRQRLLQNAVSHALQAAQPLLAFEAVRDGKAGVLSDLRQLLGPVVAVDAEITAARTSLGRWLHSEQGKCPPADAERETRARTRHYFQTWNIARSRTATTGAPEENSVPL